MKYQTTSSDKRNALGLLSAAIVLAFCSSGGAAAQSQRSDGSSQPTTAADTLAEAWAKMRGELISAEELLNAEVGNGLHPVGEVADLVMTRDGAQVQYILYKTPYPYTLVGGIDGFARYDGAEFDQGFSDLTVRLEAEDSASAPEELTLTREQARRRLVSSLIGEPMLFVGNDARQIEDLLIDKDTGAVIHYVVETEDANSSLFDSERRTVPAARVRIEEDGDVVAALEISELPHVQLYDPALL